MRARVWALWRAAALLGSLGACGLPERDNPMDPESAEGQGGILLEASLPDGPVPAGRVASLRFQVTGPDAGNQDVVLASGAMSLVGRTARATVRGVPAGSGRRFQVEALDGAGIRTFAAEKLVEVGPVAPTTLRLALLRLTGDLELTAYLPPEVALVEVVVEADADSLRLTLPVDGAAPQRIAGIPTGAEVAVVVRLRDAEDQTLLEQHLTADIRDGLLARVTLAQDAGALEIVAHFPAYIPIVQVDRFGDEAARFFARSNDATLPEAGEPVDFDQWPFQVRGLGPNGEGITFYNFDVRPTQPAPVYVAVDRRGAPVPGQLPIFDLLPGDPGHSDLWQIHHVHVVERTYAPNSLTSLAQIQERELEVVATGSVMNCVMVPDGSR
ncbi:MAG: hypothetical protein AB1505_06430, partial [Candidatus Latescibacterota bacterium]